MTPGGTLADRPAPGRNAETVYDHLWALEGALYRHLSASLEEGGGGLNAALIGQYRGVAEELIRMEAKREDPASPEEGATGLSALTRDLLAQAYRELFPGNERKGEANE